MRCSSQPFLLAVKLNLHAQDILHSLGGFFLCRGGNMGIGVQGEACGEVSQHAGYRLNVHTILKRDSCEGVAEVVESDLRDASSLQYSFEHIVDAVRRDRTTVGGMGRCMALSVLSSLLSVVLELLSLGVRWLLHDRIKIKRRKCL